MKLTSSRSSAQQTLRAQQLKRPGGRGHTSCVRPVVTRLPQSLFDWAAELCFLTFCNRYLPMLHDSVLSSAATYLVLGVVLFAATNVDDIFVLLGFFAHPQFRPGRVVAGQYIGIGTLVSVSVAASAISLVIPPPYVGLLGLAPIAIGIKKLFDL